jgi:ADP-ribose pyrophosphatase YjhB (NUDIX family)
MARNRSGLILLQGDSIALIRRVKDGQLYYAIPGGGVEDGETFEAACVREALEELGVVVRIDRLAATVTVPDGEQRYYHCTQTGGSFGTGDGEEYHKIGADALANTHEPVWFPLENIARITLYPRCVAALAAASALAGWPDAPRHYDEWIGGFAEI